MIKKREREKKKKQLSLAGRIEKLRGPYFENPWPIPLINDLDEYLSKIKSLDFDLETFNKRNRFFNIWRKGVPWNKIEFLKDGSLGLGNWKSSALLNWENVWMKSGKRLLLHKYINIKAWNLRGPVLQRFAINRKMAMTNQNHCCMPILFNILTINQSESLSVIYDWSQVFVRRGPGLFG